MHCNTPHQVTKMLTVDESCHMWMSHVPYEWGLPTVNDESCHTWLQHMQWAGRWGKKSACGWWVILDMIESYQIWMSHVRYEWVMLDMNESCQIWMSHVTHEWVLSHMNESCPTWMRHMQWAGRWKKANDELVYIWLQHTQWAGRWKVLRVKTQRKKERMPHIIATLAARSIVNGHTHTHKHTHAHTHTHTHTCDGHSRNVIRVRTNTCTSWQVHVPLLLHSLLAFSSHHFLRV